MFFDMFGDKAIMLLLMRIQQVADGTARFLQKHTVRDMEQLAHFGLSQERAEVIGGQWRKLLRADGDRIPPRALLDGEQA